MPARMWRHRERERRPIIFSSLGEERINTNDDYFHCGKYFFLPSEKWRKHKNKCGICSHTEPSVNVNGMHIKVTIEFYVMIHH